MPIACAIASGSESLGRDRALFELLYVTGMRIHEALGLTWDEIYNNGGDWYVQILGKGHKTRSSSDFIQL